METGRHKRDREPFLGTADIIARVHAVQARPMRRILGTVSWYGLLAGVCAVALCSVAALYRQRVVRGHKGEVPSAPLVSAASGRQESHAPGLTPRASPPAAGPQPVRVALKQQSGSMWLDGTKVADKKRTWNGRLAPGNHQLAVRVNGRTMRLTFVVETEGLTITVDPSQQSFRVNAQGQGHKTGRAH